MTFTRGLLAGSAVFMGAAGLGLTFMAEELLRHVRQPDAPILVVFVQTIGALYLAFAVLNWLLRGSVMGGIYGRPLALANQLHFLMVAILLVRWAVTGGPPGIAVLAVVYSAFALGFLAVMFRDPGT
ncbi:MAG TPA: hypothetical protein VFZ36_03705 [Vicinamibacterales bacterium]